MIMFKKTMSYRRLTCCALFLAGMVGLGIGIVACDGTKPDEIRYKTTTYTFNVKTMTEDGVQDMLTKISASADSTDKGPVRVTDIYISRLYQPQDNQPSGKE